MTFKTCSCLIASYKQLLIHRPIKGISITSRISPTKVEDRNPSAKGLHTHMRGTHACKTDRIGVKKTTNDVALKLIPVRPSWSSRPLWNKADPKGSPLSGGSQAVGLKKWSIATTNHATGGGESLSDWDELPARLENDLLGADPRGEKSVSHKARPYISPRNIIARTVDAACSLHAFAKTRFSLVPASLTKIFSNFTYSCKLFLLTMSR